MRRAHPLSPNERPHLHCALQRQDTGPGVCIALSCASPPRAAITSGLQRIGLFAFSHKLCIVSTLCTALGPLLGSGLGLHQVAHQTVCRCSAQHPTLTAIPPRLEMLAYAYWAWSCRTWRYSCCRQMKTGQPMQTLRKTNKRTQGSCKSRRAKG